MSKRRSRVALFISLVMAVLTMAAQPVHAELNDTIYSYFAQSPDPERLDITATGGDAQILASWSPITRYTGPKAIRYYVDVQSPGLASPTWGQGLGCTVTTSALAPGRPSCVVSGLENGRTYYVHLTAAAIDLANEDTVGKVRVGGDMGNPAVVKLCCTPLGPVSQVALTDNGSGRGTVSWMAPQDTGGGTDLRYEVSVSPDGLTCTSTETSCVITGLRPNTVYSAVVTASNRSFTSATATSPAVRVPPESPEAPFLVKARLAGTRAVLTWKRPANAASANISRYVVRSSPRGLTCAPGDRTACTVTGLTPGVSYSFQVAAVGGAKVSPYSKPSPTVTRPLPPPPPPSTPVPAPSESTKPPVPVS